MSMVETVFLCFTLWGLRRRVLFIFLALSLLSMANLISLRRMRPSRCFDLDSSYNCIARWPGLLGRDLEGLPEKREALLS